MKTPPFLLNAGEYPWIRTEFWRFWRGIALDAENALVKLESAGMAISSCVMGNVVASQTGFMWQGQCPVSEKGGTSCDVPKTTYPPTCAAFGDPKESTCTVSILTLSVNNSTVFSISSHRRGVCPPARLTRHAL